MLYINVINIYIKLRLPALKNYYNFYNHGALQDSKRCNTMAKFPFFAPASAGNCAVN